jgi:RHS repeat-associated protein
MGGSAYKYDGAGNRIQQTVGANVGKYLLDLNCSLPTVLAETLGANVTRFVHSLRGLHQLKTSGGSWDHILTDALGSLRVVTDNTVAVLESRNYGVYGDLFGTTGSSQTSYGYTGEPTDGNGLVYDRARYLSPALGQFVSLDPMETFNRYAYVDGNPVMQTDPSGLVVAVQPRLPTNDGDAPRTPRKPVGGSNSGGTANNGGGSGASGGGGGGAGPGLVYGGGVPPVTIIVRRVVNTLSAINFLNMISRFGRGFNGGSCPAGYKEYYEFMSTHPKCFNPQGALITQEEAAREAANPPPTGPTIDLVAAFKQNILAPIVLGAYKYIDWWNGVLTPVREHPLESLVIGMGVPLAAYAIYATGGKILDPIRAVVNNDITANALAGAAGYVFGTIFYSGMRGEPVKLDAGLALRYAAYGAAIGAINKYIKSVKPTADADIDITNPIVRGGLMGMIGGEFSYSSYSLDPTSKHTVQGGLISAFGGFMNGITGQIDGFPGVFLTSVSNTFFTAWALDMDASITTSTK